jgi:replicative DNA helicase
MSAYQKGLIHSALNPFNSKLELILENGITSEDFTGDYKVIWKEIEKVFSTSGEVTDLKILGNIPTMAIQLQECMDTAVSEYTLPSVIVDVKHESLLRRLKSALFEFSEEVRDKNSSEVETFLGSIQQRFLNIETNESKKVVLYEAMINFVEKCREGNYGTIPWPVQRIQNRYGNLSEEFIVLHALPSVGKTAFVIQWMVFLARRGIKTALASLESSVSSISPRFISHLGQVNSLTMKCAGMSPSSEKKAQAAIEEATLLEKLMIIRDGNMNDGQLLAWCRIQKQQGAKMIFIDNLRHIDSVKTFETEIRKFMELSLSVKRIRDQIKIPVVLLHHSNESGDIGWSKDIRKDVDIEIAMERVNPPTDGQPDDIRLNFKKARDAGTFSVEVEFDKEYQTYRESL